MGENIHRKERGDTNSRDGEERDMDWSDWGVGKLILRIGDSCAVNYKKPALIM